MENVVLNFGGIITETVQEHLEIELGESNGTAPVATCGCRKCL